MRHNPRPARYLPPADTVRQNRIAVRARAMARARFDADETRVTIAYYRAGGAL